MQPNYTARFIIGLRIEVIQKLKKKKKKNSLVSAAAKVKAHES